MASQGKPFWKCLRFKFSPVSASRVNGFWCDPPALETYLVLFALTSIWFLSLNMLHFSALQIRWDLCFFFFVCFCSSGWVLSVKVFEVSVPSTNAWYLPSIWLEAMHSLLPHCTNKSLQSQLSGVLLISSDPIISCFWPLRFAYQLLSDFMQISGFLLLRIELLHEMLTINCISPTICTSMVI